MDFIPSPSAGSTPVDRRSPADQPIYGEFQKLGSFIKHRDNLKVKF
jgi:hypothetical protein